MTARLRALPLVLFSALMPLHASGELPEAFLDAAADEAGPLSEDDFLGLIEQLSAEDGTGAAGSPSEADAPNGADTADTADSAPLAQPAAADEDDLLFPEDAGELLEPYGSAAQEVRRELDIPGADHALCERFRNQYRTENGRAQLVRALMDSTPYRPYIRQQLEERGLPLVLQYLPIVESNYKTGAISRSGATGLWQFMENSMSPFLSKNAWYDERYDPWKSTDAALSKLSDNYTMFGDWALALAAYNCGAGAMSRILKANEGSDFWYLAEHNLLSQQSALYVPKLLAIADLVENAGYYGLSDVLEAAKQSAAPAVEEFDYLTVAGMMSFSQIASLTGIDKDTVTRLNPALFRKCTPAGATYALRLPKGTAEEAEAALKDAGVATDALIHTVQKGDTLWGISRRYGVTVDDLCVVNGIRENGILSIGQKVIVPIFK